MKKTYYLFNPGRLSRRDNTLKFVPVAANGNEGTPKYIPIEGVADLFCFGSLDTNSALYNFLGKAGIAVHFFDFYEHYTGSFMPKEYLLAGKMQIEQTKHYIDKKKRMVVAKKFVSGASFNMVKNLRYYINRERDLQHVQDAIERYTALIDTSTEVDELMGIEGNIRQTYYSAFNDIITADFTMENRSKRPPQNEINALISFGNMMCYTLCLGQIYHTQLNPTISFLHEPGYRRYSLALDLAEIFKPLLVDRLIFRLLNKKEIQASDFDHQLNSCVLKESGRKVFVRAWEEKINETFKHPILKRNVSYKHLIKLECYKLSKHLLGIEEYKPFKARW
ncbi:type I-B CRISPR-associated endonuclease Cas1 [Myroides marinus]|uniref:type I-B CRISPR-associated endonuclease Cas1b n=1 Tax=Myroides marinus TaxID=703342 RepID=UPI000741A4F4|nr:type I-B CRISPR-associated endonuclease Cas1b [Myroides marinus]KUF43927.1 type I-B CRISPR-associated endonuclease Cas1 [Myroides marinus]MDM1349708.1 type I-B CRISPR-associated endonuclease Cas1 [Myroides marinus]MDM1353653.1 type I-B CRISPR-associated endonuclease Cas1 [Myroides marinus]MDM1356917.1 type I-B CRISPR-associated endonuclease Cas1 [Myroides marinus]MDM1361693.1 type I-B CRISPR-associated endonuclease Cas1 [Myroides marinus]